MALNIVERIDDEIRVRHILVSCSDKTGVEEFVSSMIDINPDVVFYSTGGTYRVIEASLTPEQKDRNLVSVSAYTGQPEMQGGLVKTLDFKIYLGLLSETYNEAHAKDLSRVGGVSIDMVAANLYPFKETVGASNVTPEMARTNIDIGGPCMVRAAAKNFLRVASVTDPGDYAGIVQELSDNYGKLCLGTRFRLARKAFAHTAEYDKAIAGYFESVKELDVAGSYRTEG